MRNTATIVNAGANRTRIGNSRALAALPAVLVLLWCLMGARVPAQDGLTDMIFTAGTTWHDSHGRDWAYIAWQGTTPGLVTGRVFAVYCKNGDPASTALFTRKAVVAFQTDARVIEPLLNRAAMIGDNLPKLGQDITNLFDKIVPAGGVDLPAMVSALLRGARNDASQYNNLVLLSRLHPAINFCIGTAHAEVMQSATNTFELRLFDPASLKDIAVVGRITLVAGQPTVLPAPGGPVLVPDTSAKGDLNAKLRWATPDPLRRLGLLSYGYNIYRMTTNFAVANGYHATPPAPAVLTNLAASNPNVRRVNNLPILASKDFSAADVGNFVVDPATYFMADDNRRFEPGATNFLNGDRFYYFATARDILGRDGLVSPGTLVVICDRMPPSVPRKVKVYNDYHYIAGNPRQKLRVDWMQNTNSAAETTMAYHVYRWTSITQMHALARNVLSNRIAIVPHVTGSLTNFYVDLGAGSPSIATDAGSTFWYTVRAQDNGACGTNVSGNSSPAFGVLRDRTGPDSQGGGIRIWCVQPVVSPKGASPVQTPAAETNCHRYHLICSRFDPRIQWVDFYVNLPFPLPGGTTAFLGRRYFTSLNGTSIPATFDYCYTNEPGVGLGPTFLCQAGTVNGRISPFASQPGGFSQNPNDIINVNFDASLLSYQTDPSPDCFSHDPRPPGETNVHGIDICFNTATNSYEWRVYRRVDGAPLTLISQGTNQPSAAVCTTDDVMPVNSGALCYFVQLLDEHGNASPMQRLGCTEFSGVLPTPVLSPIEPAGTETNAMMCLNWFCPTFGVERFEVWIAGPVASNASVNLVNTNPVTTPLSVDLNGSVQSLDWNVFRSMRAGPGFGNGALFTVKVRVDLGQAYTVFLKSVGNDGSVSTNISNIEQFSWYPTNTPTQMVPWPARGLPPLTNTISANLVAARVTNTFFNGLGVRIGVATNGGPAQGNKDLRPYATPGTNDPMTWLFANALGQTAFPVCLYRYQVTNAMYPVVSGDLIQVSPLMERIAYGIVAFNEFLGSGPAAAIYDPFIVMTRASGANPAIYGIYLVDTQPVILGARYRYLLVRFKDNHEIDQVIPTNEVEVTP
ncbi:MAG: hypothetical protein QOF48_642 [Verrucomicrobiota bacterium]|jgi:hypothetical protein